MHTAKDHLITLPCAYTRQRGHVARACAFWCRGGLHTEVFTVRASPSTHDKGWRWAHGNAARMATPRRTATRRCTAKMRGARQRWIARQRIIARGKDEFHGKVSRCTAKRELHGKDCRAVLMSRTIKTVLPGQALSCGLYRASTHGNAFAVHAEVFSVQLACMATPAFLIVPVLFLGAGGDTSRSLPCCCNLQMKFVSFQSGRSPNPENKSSIWNQSCTNLKRRLKTTHSGSNLISNITYFKRE
jgi:hypothetical protein